MTAVGTTPAGDGYCSACFTGAYPVALGAPDEAALVKLRRSKV